MADQYVFIIDDDDAVRDAMCMLMETRDLPFKAFSNADEFFDYYDSSQHGCLVLDIRMPGISGLELQEKLKKEDSILPIIFITGHGDVDMAVEAMRQGALDFMRKPINEQNLLDSIEDALSREIKSHKKITTLREKTDLLNTLTPREKEIFNLVSEGLTNKYIAIDKNISERTVEVHRSSVMKKLGLKTMAQLVRFKIDITRSPDPL